jgi:hypothetical protein
MATYGNVTNAGSQPTSSATNLAGMASGADAGKDPYLMQMLQDNANLIGNRVASQMSGAGRLGSFGYGDQMARSITAANAPILSNAYQNDKHRQLAASGQIDQSNNAAQAMQLGAAQGQTNALNFGQQNAAQWASMMPQLQQSAYMPGNTLLGIGGLQDAYNQQNIDAQRQLFEQQQAMPWTQLARYSGAVSGLSPLMANAGSMTGTMDTQKQLGLQDYMGMFAGGGNSGAAGMANAGSSILGMLSDRNEKTDIKKVGDDPGTGIAALRLSLQGRSEDLSEDRRPDGAGRARPLPGSTETVGGKLYIKKEALGILGL